MGDRDIKKWDERLQDQVKRGWTNYIKRRIHLDTVRDLELFSLSGEFLYIEEVSSDSARAQIRLNKNTNDDLDLVNGAVIKTIFAQFYLTHIAQPGEWLDFVIGTNFEYYKQTAGSGRAGEAQQAIIITNALANTNTVGPNNPCNRILIKAHLSNNGTAWVDFGTAAVANSCFELAAGDTVSVPLSNTNRINALFTVANENVTALFSV